MSILGDLNGWIGDEKRASITGAFGVPGENNNCTEVYISTKVWQGVKKEWR